MTQISASHVTSPFPPRLTRFQAFHPLVSGNQGKITFTNEFFGFKFHRHRPSLRKNITKLVYIPKHLAKDYEGHKTQVPAELEIWAGVQKYQILTANTNFQFRTNTNIKSEAELEWLAHELSDYLDIPIQMIFQR